MKVLYCTETFWPHIGGIEIHALRYLPAMKNRGHEFIVFTSHSGLNLPDKSIYRGTPIYRFHFHKTLTDRNIVALKSIRNHIARLKQSFKPDLVHINSITPDTFFHIHKNNPYHLPLLLTIHGLPMIKLSGHNPFLKKTLRSANWIAAVSKSSLMKTRQIEPKISSRSSVIYNGLDIPDIQPQPLPFDAPCLLCLGRLFPYKGFDLALTAFSMIRDRFPHARLVIAGNGPEKFNLEKQVKALNIIHQVLFKDWVNPERIPDLINEATMVIMPSRSETFGLVALETAQMARPIVATRVGGLPEVIDHQKTGLLIDKDDLEGLGKAIIYLLEHPDIAEQMGQAAKIRAQKMFSLEQHIDAYDNLYKKLN